MKKLKEFIKISSTVLVSVLVVSSVVFATTTVGDNVSVGGTLGVTGASTFSGAVTLGDASGDAITITGTPTFGQNIGIGVVAIDGTYFDVAATTGAVTLTQQAAATAPFTLTGIVNGTVAGLDLNTKNVAGSVIEIDWTATTTNALLSAIDVDLTNLTPDATNAVYGFHLNDPASSTASTEYGVYVEGTNWDYGIYNADAGYVGGLLTAALGIDTAGSTTDITLQNDETITNAVDGSILFTSPVLTHAYDAGDYWTATQADAGAVTFDSVSDGGTAGFTFSDAVTANSGINITAATAASGGKLNSIITSDGTTANRAIKGQALATTTATEMGDQIGLYGVSTFPDGSATMAASKTMAGGLFWTEMLDTDVTYSSGGIYAGIRNIVEQVQDLDSIAGGGESALIYHQAYNNATGGNLDYGVYVGNNMDTANKTIGSAYHAYSASGASFNYGLSLTDSTINTADIIFQNAETLSNATDGGIITSGWFQVGNATIAASITCDAAAEGTFAVFTDAADATDCTVGSGSTRNLCVCADAVWTDM